jgi:hypothetical protein
LVNEGFQLLLLVRYRAAEGREVVLDLLLACEKIGESRLVACGHFSAGRLVAQRRDQWGYLRPGVDASAA